MKYLMFILALIVCSFIDHLAIAGETPTKSTTYGYDRENFCAEGAQKKVEYLNNLTKPDVEKIEALKKKINELEAKKKIISDMQSLRNEYLASFQAINSENEMAKESSVIKKSSIDQLKKLLNKALTLDAILLLNQNGFSNNSATPTVKSLCTSENAATKENSKLLFCLRYGEQGSARGIGNDSEIEGLNNTLAHFSESMNQITDSEPVVRDVMKIIDSIPNNLKPDGVLEVFAKKAPGLQGLFTNAGSRDELMNCLDNGKASCENLLAGSPQRGMIRDLINQEIKTTGEEFSGKYRQAKKQINDQNSKDLTAIIYSFDHPLEGRDAKNRELLNDKLKQVKSYSESIFNKNYPNSTSEVKNGFKDIGLEDSEYVELTNHCDIKPEVKGDELRSRIKSCEDKVRVLLAKAEIVKNKISEDTTDLKKELATLLDHNTRLMKIEKIKQFVIQRFVRGCPQTKMNSLSSNLFEIKCENLNTESVATSEKIDSLSSMFSNVLGRLQQGNTPSSKKGELGLFSKDELKIYDNYCQNTSKEGDKVLIDSCQQVNQYYSAIANQKESKDWDDFNTKYYVEYSKTNSKGYDVYEKKSNVRIFGEGVSQSINNIYPMFIGNYFMKNQIDVMTNQALYMKQINYMNNPTSPWMINNPYFQGNYFNTTGTFTGFGTTTMPTVNGFNFLK